MQLNHTHDPAATSWVASANVAGCDFPIQNLPFAVFRHGQGGEDFRGGVAAAVCVQPSLNEFFAMGPGAWQALRHGLFALLERHAVGEKVDALRTCLVPQLSVEYTVPARIGFGQSRGEILPALTS